MKKEKHPIDDLKSEIGYHAIAQRTYGAYAGRLLALHLVSSLAYSEHLVIFGLESYDRRLVDHDFIVVDNDGIGSAEIHRYLLCERKETH